MELVIAVALTMVIVALVGTLIASTRSAADTLVSRGDARQQVRQLVDGTLAQLRAAKPRAQCVKYQDYDAARASDAKQCVEQRETGGAILKAAADRFCFLANADQGSATFENGKIPTPDGVCLDASGGRLQLEKYPRATDDYVRRTIGGGITNTNGSGRTDDATALPPGCGPGTGCSGGSPSGGSPEIRYLGSIPDDAAPFEYGQLPLTGDSPERDGLVWSDTPLDPDRIVAVRMDVTVNIDLVYSSASDQALRAGNKTLPYRLKVEATLRAPQYGTGGPTTTAGSPATTVGGRQ